MGLFKHLQSRQTSRTPVAMFVFKCFIPLLILCYVQENCCKPMENELTNGRGMGSTIWGWITYPFSWWSGAPEEPAPPAQSLLTASSTYGPYDDIEIAKRNLTIWCNDHTCTTMECDKIACKNITCSIYDTDVNGRCREYNIGMKPEEPAPPKPTEPTPKPINQDKVDKVTQAPTEVSVTSAAPITTQAGDLAAEHPLELEAALSSTVPEQSVESLPGDKVDKSSPQNKIKA